MWQTTNRQWLVLGDALTSKNICKKLINCGGHWSTFKQMRRSLLANLFDLFQLPGKAFTVKASVLVCSRWHIGASNAALRPLPLKNPVGHKTESELAWTWAEVLWAGFLAKPVACKTLETFRKDHLIQNMWLNYLEIKNTAFLPNMIFWKHH